MEVKDDTVTISTKEYLDLQANRLSLLMVKRIVKEVREKDGRLLLPPKCVEMLLEVMEDV